MPNFKETNLVNWVPSINSNTKVNNSILISYDFCQFLEINILYLLIVKNCVSIRLCFENSLNKKNAQVNLAFFLINLFIRDHGRIQTCNLLSRNQVRYSVAPHGQFCGCKYIPFLINLPNKFQINPKHFW